MTPTGTASSSQTFAQSISNSGALQLVGVIANFSGILSSALAVYSFIEGLNQPSNATILNAIEQLQQALQSDFTQLGDLIVQQTQTVVDTVNRDAMAGALANSDVATDRIQAFLSSNDQDALQTAITESIAGVQFFLELDLSAPADLFFFLPGLVKAGTIRIFVIASEPKSAQEPSEVVIDNINSMVNLLSTMINSIKATVSAAHTVVTESHTIQCGAQQEVQAGSEPGVGPAHRTVTVINGYYHDERGAILEFFDAQKENDPCEQPSGLEQAALAAAEQAQTQGIYDELAFMGIPGFEEVLQSWTALVATNPAPVITTLIDLNGTWVIGGVAGPVITVKGNSISIEMPAFHLGTTADSLIASGAAASVSSPIASDKIVFGPSTAGGDAPADSIIAKLGSGSISSVAGGVLASGVGVGVTGGSTASGFIIDSGDISVNFPGTGTLTGEIQLPNSILWSNNTEWTKA
jgi:hypothetical protein